MEDCGAPLTVEEFQQRVLELSGTLPRRLRQCADFVAANPDRIAVSTVAELSDAAGVQPSAFMRFCQLLGFSGYTEFQRLFRSTYTQRWPDYETRLRNLKEGGGESPAALLAEFVDAGRNSLENLIHSVDSDMLNQAVATLAGAQMIHIIGLRRAFPVAAYLAYAFEKMDIPALLHDTVGKLDHRHAIRDGDVLIAVTFPPYSGETLELAHYAHASGNQVVAITDTNAGPLHRDGAITLTVSEVDVGAFRALSATLSLALALVVAVGTARRANGI